MAEQKIICAGFGGQGVMSMGRLIAYTGMLEGLEVSWMPSYGPEMRGGTANCSVIVSDHPIGSPIIARDATAAIVMNLPSLHKFEYELLPQGVLVVNESLITDEAKRDDLRIMKVPANGIAQEVGNAKAANMVMLGAYLGMSDLFRPESVVEALKKVFGARKAAFFDINRNALMRGYETVAQRIS